MYENYVGLTVNVILSDGREVLGIITEVLDSAGSLKLSNARIFRTPNDPPRELSSFTIPANRIQNVNIVPQDRSESNSPMPSQAAATSIPTTSILTEIKPKQIASELQTNSSISDTTTTTTASPEVVFSLMSPNVESDHAESHHDRPVAELEKPATPTSSASSRIPSFASAKPNKTRNFVETIEMEYDDLWEKTKSPVIKGKQTSKLVDAAIPDQTNTITAIKSSARQHNVQKPLLDEINRAVINDQANSTVTIKAPAQQHNGQQPLLDQINRASKPAMNNIVDVLPNPQQPSVDEKATNQLLANLNIGKVRSGSLPKSEIAQTSPKKLPSFSIPAGLIPPKARRKESYEAAMGTLEEKQKREPEKTIIPAAETANIVESASPIDRRIPVSSIRTVSEGHDCPLVTPSLMRKVHAICDSESGPNHIMIMESAGVSAAMMALKAIGGHRRIQPTNHNAAPLVVVLAGNNNYAGSYGLAAARHLLNRGCQVIVCIAAGANANISQRIASQEYVIQLAGGRIVRRVEDLPPQLTTPVDIIIDALLGSQTSFADLKSDYESLQIVTAAMDWANNNKAPVLSLDFPSGIDPLQGTPYHVNHRIKPKWTLCYGAPNYGCTSRSVTGELFLADIGIPEYSWKKAHVQPIVHFGQDIIVALEYDTQV